MTLLVCCLAAAIRPPPRGPAAHAAEGVADARLQLVGQAGGPVGAIAARAGTGGAVEVFVGAGRGITVLEDDGEIEPRIVGRSALLAEPLTRLVASPAHLAGIDASGAVHLWHGSAAAPLELRASLPPGAGPASDLLIDGDRLYVAAGAAGVRAYTIGADGSLAAVGAIGVLGQATRLATSPIDGRRLLYVASGADGLRVIDVEDLPTATVLATILAPTAGVAARGALLFAAQGAGPMGADGRLAIYNLTQPELPKRIVEPRPDMPVGPHLVTDGILLYSCPGGNAARLESILIRNPGQLVRPGLDGAGPPLGAWLDCKALAIGGRSVYVASWAGRELPPERRHGGVAVLDRQVTNRLRYRHSVDLRPSVGDLVALEGRVWLADSAHAGTPSAGLRAVELSDPRRPRLGGAQVLERPTAGPRAEATPFARTGGLVVDPLGRWLHAQTDGGYHRLDSLPAGLGAAGHLPLWGGAELPPARMAVTGDRVLLTEAGARPGGLTLLEGAAIDASLVRRRGLLRRGGEPTDMEPLSDLTVVTVRQGGLRVVESPPGTEDWELAGLALPAESWALEISGTRAFVANGEAGLITVDLTDPLDPRELARFEADPPRGRLVDLALGRPAGWASGRQVLVLLEQLADGSLLRILDVEGPGPPAPMGLATVAPAARVRLDGERILLSSEDHALEVFVPEVLPTRASPTPTESPSPTPSPSATATPDSPTPSPTATGSTEPVPTRGARAFLPILGLTFDFRIELYLVLEAAPADQAAWEPMRQLGLAALAGLGEGRDRAALIQFDPDKATVVTAGESSAVRAALTRLAPAAGGAPATARLDRALEGVAVARGLLAPAPRSAQAPVLVLASGPPPSSRVDSIRDEIRQLEAAGRPVFVLAGGEDDREGWRALLAEGARHEVISDAAAARRALNRWVSGGWK